MTIGERTGSKAPVVEEQNCDIGMRDHKTYLVNRQRQVQDSAVVVVVVVVVSVVFSETPQLTLYAYIV